MKRLLVSIGVTCLAILGGKLPDLGAVDTVTIQEAVIGPFGGLNTRDNPAILGASQAQDMLNVDVTPNGKSVKKREGFGLDTTFPFSTTGVHGVYKFFDSAGNEIRLVGQDTGLYASASGASFIRVATGTLSTTWQCTDWLGQAYCVTSARDTPIRTNGTIAGTTYQGTIPSGNCIASTADRLLVGSTLANPSRIYYSGSTNFTDFTLGVLPTSSSFEDITAPGSQIEHLAYHYGYWMWWKDQSFGFMAGTGQFDLQTQVVSDTIGTFDNTDIFWQGMTYFRGSDSHIYAYDGATLSPMTRDITPTVQGAGHKKSNSWLQTTQADFLSGSFTTTSYNASFSGVIVSTDNVNPPDNSFESAQWTAGGACANNVGSTSGSCTVTPKDLTKYATCHGLGHSVTMIVSIKDATSGTVYGSTTVAFPDNLCSWTQTTIQSTAPAKTYVYLYAIDTVTITNTLTSPSFATSGSSVTFWYNSVYNSGEYAAFDLFQLGQTDRTGSGIYYSAVNNAPSLSSWATFSANTVTNGGTHAFYTRASTNSFTVTSSTPVWVAQTNNAVVAASTGTYFQMSDTFTVTVASQNPILQNFTFNWFEGGASDKMYATYFDYGLWFSISTGTATTNNRVLRYDLLNQIWTLYDIPSNGFLIYNNALYFGSPTVGKLYKFGSGITSDDNASINSYWKSKDYFGASPFLDEDMRTLSWYTKQSSGTLNVTYTVNGSSITNYSVNLYNASKSFLRNNRNFPIGTLVNNINFKFGDNSTNALWEVFAGQYTFVPRPWNVNQ